MARMLSPQSIDARLDTLSWQALLARQSHDFARLALLDRMISVYKSYLPHFTSMALDVAYTDDDDYTGEVN